MYGHHDKVTISEHIIGLSDRPFCAILIKCFYIRTFSPVFLEMHSCLNVMLFVPSISVSDTNMCLVPATWRNPLA